jgi:hypothetical protein
MEWDIIWHARQQELGSIRNTLLDIIHKVKEGKRLWPVAGIRLNKLKHIMKALGQPVYGEQRMPFQYESRVVELNQLRRKFL